MLCRGMRISRPRLLNTSVRTRSAASARLVWAARSSRTLRAWCTRTAVTQSASTDSTRLLTRPGKSGSMVGIHAPIATIVTLSAVNAQSVQARRLSSAVPINGT